MSNRTVTYPAKSEHTVYETATLCWSVTDDQLIAHKKETGKTITAVEYARIYYTNQDAAITSHGDMTAESFVVIPARTVRRVG
jgi:hypothetical protein